MNFRQIFFYEFKLCHSAAKMGRNIDKTWAEGSVGELTLQICFRKFRSGDFNLEDKKGRGRSTEHDDGELNTSVE
ncbi:hypothetical protein Angca_010190, partial [Angiostrongylus cantonensis]